MFRHVARFIAGSASWALLFILIAIAARILGPQEFGRLAWALAYAFLFDPLLDAGFYRLTIRKGAVRPAATGRYLAHSLLWKIAVGTAIAAALMAHRLPLPTDIRLAHAVEMMVLAGLLRSIQDAVRSGLIARGRYVRDVMSLGFERLGLFIAGLMALVQGGGLLTLCGVFVAVRLASLGVTILLARGAGSFNFHVHPRLFRVSLGSGAFAAFAAVSLALCGQIDTVMLGSLRTMVEAGGYAAAHWARAVLLVVPGLIGVLLRPRLARAHHDDPAGFSSVFGGGLKYACAAGMAVTANGLLLAPALMGLVFGEGYGQAVDTFRILLLGLPAIFGLAFLQGSLLAIGSARRAMGITVLGVAAHVALSRALIPAYGAEGAAVATVASEGALFLAFYVAVRRRLSGVAPAIFIKVPAALAVAVGGFFLAAGHGPMTQLASANAVFAAALLFMGFVAAPERRAMLTALQRRFDVAPELTVE